MALTRPQVKRARRTEAPALSTWCRACGARILVFRGDRRPDFCGLTCRLRHFWRSATWRGF